MKQVQLSLIPAPGAKPEFLFTVEALDDVDEWNAQLPSKIILEGYTRDAWAWKPGPWVELVCVSTDGRNKLPGFIKYLKERQKCAYGRFSPTAAFVVSYIQKKAASTTEMSVRLCFDLTKLANCPLIKKKVAAPPVVAPVASKQAPPAAKPAASGASANKKSGILGNLLGAQKRINKHMEHSAKPKKVVVAAAAVEAGMRTAQQVLSEFREKMEQEMLDFDSCGEVVFKTKIILSQSQKGLSDDDKARITMDVLKYIVYEAAEECNEEWIAHKEPSEFMDECEIAVYKDGHAPEEVMEEANRVELTEDMRGEQFAAQEANKKKSVNQEAKLDQERFKQAVQQEADEIAALNSNKRDRRTIEDFQRGTVQPEVKKIKQ
jgi:hypothetical protein